jgi:predicted nucleic acid-binding protein
MFKALVDANVLHSRFLRDVVIDLGKADFFKPYWSVRILEETKDSLKRINPAWGNSFEQQLPGLLEAFPDSWVTGFEHLESDLSDVDKKDVHVLAAAIQIEAGALVTFNVRDFPANLFDSHGIELIHPDDFFLDQADLNMNLFTGVIAQLIADYLVTPMDAYSFGRAVIRSQCPKFGMLILDRQDDIDQQAELFRTLT